MTLWIVVAHKDFPIWSLAHRLIRSQALDGDRVKWLLEGSWTLAGYPTSAKGVISVESAEISCEAVVATARMQGNSLLEVTEMRPWNFLDAYSLALTCVGTSVLNTMLALADPAWLTGRAARTLDADLKSEARADHVANYEGFFAGLQDGDISIFGLPIEHPRALLPYVGILCGGDSV